METAGRNTGQRLAKDSSLTSAAPQLLIPSNRSNGALEVLLSAIFYLCSPVT